MKTEIKVIMDLEGKFQELFPNRSPNEIRHGVIRVIGALPTGMSSGKPSVGIMVESGGHIIYAETSMKLLQMACAAFVARYGDVTDGEFEIRVGKDGIVVDGLGS